MDKESGSIGDDWDKKESVEKKTLFPHRFPPVFNRKSSGFFERNSVFNRFHTPYYDYY